MSDFEVPTLAGLSRQDVVRARARLLGQEAFRAAVVAGELEATDALRSVAEALVATGGGVLSADEMRVSGHE